MKRPERLSAAVSSCPNDTFAFYHLAHHNKIPGLQFEYLDIEELNLGMESERWDLVKASFPVGYKYREKYELIGSGTAIGFGVGPVVVSRKNWSYNKDIDNVQVLLPGKNTTANFLWDFYLKRSGLFPDVVVDKEFILFSEIMPRIAKGEGDLGVVIHEGRFSYQNHGLAIFLDLGGYWQNETGYPVPLGGIFVRKGLEPEVKREIEKTLKESIEYARTQRRGDTGEYNKEIVPFMEELAQEQDRTIVEQHIDLYVTGETLELSDTGKKAIELMWKMLEEGTGG